MINDSVFDPILAEFNSHKFLGDLPLTPAHEINKALDQLESSFVSMASQFVGDEVDKFVHKMSNFVAAGNVAEIKKTKISIVPSLQQLIWFLWRDGWKLGQFHAIAELNTLHFNTEFETIEFADKINPVVVTDVTTKKKDSRIKASKLLGNQSAYVSDYGIPLERTQLKNALESRSLTLANDVDEKTTLEIKEALVAAATPQPDTGKPISRKSLVDRINLALGRQSLRGEPARTEVPKIGGTSFFKRAKLIARTELTAAYATGRISSYLAAGITHVRWQSLEDPQRCRKCASRHGMVVALSDAATLAANPIPLHPNCRCIWVPIPNDHSGDDMRKDPLRSPGGLGLVAIPAAWIAGRAIASSSATLQPTTQRKKNKWLQNLITGVGVGSLSIAALYFLLLKSPVTEEVLSREERTVEREIIPSISRTTPEVPERTTPEVLSSAPQSQSNSQQIVENQIARLQKRSEKLFGQILRSVRKMNSRILMERTQMSYREAQNYKQQILDWLLQHQPQGIATPEVEQVIERTAEQLASSLQVNGVDINEATLEQLQTVFGFNRSTAVKVRTYIKYLDTIHSLEDLREIPGVGDATVRKVAARVANIRPNINSVPNTQAAVAELATQLNIRPNLAQEILNERDQGGDYLDLNDLINRIRSRLRTRPSGTRISLGRASINNIGEKTDFIPSASPSIVQGQSVRLPPATGQKPPASRQSRSGDRPNQSPQQDDIVQDISTDALFPGNTQARQFRPPSPLPAPSDRITELDNQYLQLSNEVENYHNTVKENLPRDVQRRKKKVFTDSYGTVGEATQHLNTINRRVAQMQPQVSKIEQQAENIYRAYEQILNPLTEPYFDTARTKIQAIDKQIDRVIRDLDADKVDKKRVIKQITSRLEGLRNLRSSISESVNSAQTAATRVAIAQNINDLKRSVERLQQNPFTEQLTEQINQLLDELTPERDRQLQEINAKIDQLSELAQNVRGELNTNAEQIQNSRERLLSTRSRLRQLPTVQSDLDEATRRSYRQSRRLSRDMNATREKVSNYKALELAHEEKIQELASRQAEEIANYEQQKKETIESIAPLISGIKSQIEREVSVLSSLSKPEGVNWLRQRIDGNDAEGLILRNAYAKADVGRGRLENTEQATELRFHAIEILKQQITNRILDLSLRLDSPNTISQQFLSRARAIQAELESTQDEVVVQGSERASAILEDLDKWEQGLTEEVPTGASMRNTPFQEMKQQIISDITQSRVSQAQQLGESLKTSAEWRDYLQKAIAEDTVFEIDGKLISKREIQSQLQSILESVMGSDTESSALDVNATVDNETLRIRQLQAIYRGPMAALNASIESIRNQIGPINLEINHRREMNLPTGRLESQKAGLVEQLQNLLDQVEELNRNRGFRRHGVRLALFTQGITEAPKLLFPASYASKASQKQACLLL